MSQMHLIDFPPHNKTLLVHFSTFSCCQISIKYLILAFFLKDIIAILFSHSTTSVLQRKD